MFTRAKSEKLITYSGGGHIEMLEAPDKTAREVRAYLDAVPMPE